MCVSSPSLPLSLSLSLSLPLSPSLSPSLSLSLPLSLALSLSPSPSSSPSLSLPSGIRYILFFKTVYFYFREDLEGLTYLNIELLPNSPSQNGSDSVLAFFVDLPSSGGTLPKHILASIFSIEKNNILSLPSSLQTPLQLTQTSTPTNTGSLVELTIHRFSEVTF